MDLICYIGQGQCKMQLLKWRKNCQSTENNNERQKTEMNRCMEWFGRECQNLIS